MYAKLIENKLLYAPINYTTTSGSIIVNFNKNITIMKRYGFKEVVDIKPSYDEVTEYLIISGYSESDDNITINYTVNQIELTEQEESIEEKVKQLKDVDTIHEEAIAEIMDIIGGLL